jgi:metal-responsive CopG/Arc/MetJ family transcriptional regulator
MKIGISVSDDLFEAGEHFARQTGLSRSELYSNAMLAYLSERGAAVITARLNAIYSKESSKSDPAFAHCLPKSRARSPRRTFQT